MPRRGSERAQQRARDFAAEDGDAPAVIDIEPLRQRFEALGDIPAQDDRLRRDRAALAIEIEALAAAVAALDPAPGALDRVRALPLPDRATIAKFASAHRARRDRAQAARCDALAKIDDAIAVDRGRTGAAVGRRHRADRRPIWSTPGSRAMPASMRCATVLDGDRDDRATARFDEVARGVTGDRRHHRPAAHRHRARHPA